jgi:hypothetical protein
MAITQVGSVLRFELANADTGSQAIDVPVGTDFIIIAIASFDSATAGRFNNGLYTFPKGGVATPMGAFGADTSISTFMAGLFYLAGPDVGSAKSFTWDFSGTGSLGQVPLMSVTFWQGVYQLDPVRDRKGVSAAGAAMTTPVLNARLSDLIVAFTGFFASTGTEGSITTWTNLTELAELAHYTGSEADGAWATASPTGPQTCGIAAAVNYDDGSLAALSLRSQADPEVVVTRSGRSTKRRLRERNTWRI